MPIIYSLLLLLVANGSPIVARLILGEHRYSWPVDGGAVFIDQRRFFGPHKTLRGILASILFTLVLSGFLGIPFDIAGLFAAYAMLGDLISSFIKRRLNIAPGKMIIGLDQLPESLLPLLLLQTDLALSWQDVGVTTVLFILLELGLSSLLPDPESGEKC